MAKVYVACKKLKRAAKVLNGLRSRGHQITYDWTIDYNEESPVDKAVGELNGIRAADIFIYLWEPDAESARYEAGIAMGFGKKIIVSGGPDSLFFNLPNIHRVDLDEEILKALQ